MAECQTCNWETASSPVQATLSKLLTYFFSIWLSIVPSVYAKWVVAYLMGYGVKP